MIKNLAGQKIGAQMVSATDGSAFTGAVTVYVTGNAGIQAIGSVSAGLCVHEGNGYHTYAPSEAETNYDLIAFTFIGTGAIPQTLQVFTSYPQTGDSFSLYGTGGSGTTALGDPRIANPDAITAQDVVANALTEIGIVGPRVTPASEECRWALGKLNRLVDRWNAQKPFAYQTVFTTYTLTAALAPHTIGPAGATFTETQRPVAIDGANLLISATVRTPIRIRDKEWWQHQRVRSLSTSIPTDLYYDPSWPNGTLNFWPVPSTALQVELIVRIYLMVYAMTDAFTLPPGYEDALTLTLAEECAGPLGVPAAVLADLKPRAQAARAVVASLNYFIPRISTRDGGMPGTGGGGYNFLTGEVS